MKQTKRTIPTFQHVQNTFVMETTTGESDNKHLSFSIVFFWVDVPVLSVCLCKSMAKKLIERVEFSVPNRWRILITDLVRSVGIPGSPKESIQHLNKTQEFEQEATLVKMKSCLPYEPIRSEMTSQKSYSKDLQDHGNSYMESLDFNL